jgi:hypothetical protein
MEFKQAMRTVKRICEAVGSCNKCVLLGNCPFVTIPSNIDLDKIESILAIWAEEHPEKTIMDDFFEKHPKAPKTDGGTPYACAVDLGYSMPSSCHREMDCCAECWRRPLEEVE